MSKITAAISAVGKYLPDYILTNKELETLVETNDDWITSRTGIKERRILKEPNQGTSFMAIRAAKDLLQKSNVDPKIFLEVLNSTYFKTGMSENKAFKMIEGKHDATFTLANLKKDITTMTSASMNLGIELPMITKAEEIYENAIKEGLGDLDYTGIIQYIKKN